MTIDPILIERIYEAAAVPDRWEHVLQDIADRVGAMGGVLLARSPEVVTMIASPRVRAAAEDFVAEGWGGEIDLVAPLLAEQYPGFRSETAYRTIEEIERMPVHRDFFAPRGMTVGVATVMQGAQDDMLQVTMEGFTSYAVAEQAVATLDLLRPSIARALSLTARLKEVQARGTVSALELAGVSAAIVCRDGRLRAANDRFVDRMGERMIERGGRLAFVDRFLQARFTEALAAAGGDAVARSVAVAACARQSAAVLHLLPLRRDAREVAGWDGVLILLAEPANASVPEADVLRLLFDLTPAEARLARHLLDGRTPAEAAATMGVAEATVRTHLSRVFAKTGVSRQTELVRLLLGLGSGRCESPGTHPRG